jgi:nitroreductase
MDIVKAVGTRKSIRGFKPDPVPKEIIRNILSIACRAPSGSNIQPWEFTAITGDVLENIRQDNAQMFQVGAIPVPERTSAEKPPHSVYRARQVELGRQLYRLMGIAHEDTEKRRQWRERGFRYFDAPAVIIISSDQSLSETGSLMDIGMVTQTICLVAMHYGLGTCIEGQGVAYPDILRKRLGIPASKRIIISIAIGYPDWDFPANRIASTRADIDDITTWCGFD